MPSYKDCVSSANANAVDTTASNAEHLTGRVKWFKSGYGFITVTDGVRSGTDVFVHYNAIQLTDMYRYLVQGEYVEFDLVKNNEGDKHEFHADNVTGVKGGKLLCQTRREAKLARASAELTEGETKTNVPVPKQRKPRENRPQCESDTDVSIQMEAERLVSELKHVNWQKLLWLTQHPDAVNMLSDSSHNAWTSMLSFVQLVSQSEAWTPVSRKKEPVRRSKTPRPSRTSA